VATEDVDCRAASRLLSQAQDRALAPEELAALKRHLDRCFMCRNFETQLDFLRRASRRMASRG
jgi:predicted anti-sigma-YlaC factor YlaD